ncbi:MAG: hypothetical protein J5I93_05550 [Pirellulaceae bacterium]|nr:hypothetical protein [Pirellulaceae bacterium]
MHDQPDRDADAARPEKPSPRHELPDVVVLSGDVLLAEAVPPPRSRWRWLVLLAPLLLVAGPIAIGELPHEVAMWHGAAALEHHLDGDTPAALHSLERGLAWQPDSPQLLVQRSEWHEELGDLEAALADAQAAVERNERSAAALLQRSIVLRRLGRHDEAIEDWNRLVDLADGGVRLTVRKLNETQQIDVYNGRAYARAVANQQLPDGLADVRHSIELLGENVAVLDTRGYLYFLLDDLDSARMDLDRATVLAEQYYAEASQPFGPRRQQDDQPAGDGQAGDGQAGDGQAGDGQPPAEDGQAELDERSEPPREPTGALRHRFLDAREMARFRQEVAELVAVVRYHRALVLERLGELPAAQADRDRVVELGFTPGPELY